VCKDQSIVGIDKNRMKNTFLSRHHRLVDEALHSDANIFKLYKYVKVTYYCIII